MKLDKIALQRILDLGDLVKQGFTPIQAKQAIEYAVAKALAFDAIIPTSKVANERSWYLANVASSTEAILSDINETVVLNFSAVLEQAYAIWRCRVALVWDPYAHSNWETIKNLVGEANMNIMPSWTKANECNTLNYIAKSVLDLLVAEDGAVARQQDNSGNETVTPCY